MNLEIPPELQDFRKEVRAFIKQALPADMARRTSEGWHPSESDYREWMRILNEKGWAAPEWPVEHGGAGWSPLQGYLFEQECSDGDAPHVHWGAGYSLVGPVIINFGSQEQKETYLPRILKGEHFWCQGFSEPNAGSDLASLKTTAVRDGDEYIVNGQKIWTTGAQLADFMFALVRTDSEVKPQRGLSCLIIDMKSPSLTVRGIDTIDNAWHVNEVFFDDVRVPAENLVGEENKGWTYAKFLLGNERHSNALVQRIKREIRKLRDMAGKAEFGGRFLDSAHFRRKLCELEIDAWALEWAVLRSASAHGAMDGRDMALASSLKVEGSYLQQRVADMQMDILGPWAAPEFIEPELGPWVDERPADAPEDVPGVVTKTLFRRAATIYGGSNDIQRSIISRAMSGK